MERFIIRGDIMERKIPFKMTKDSEEICYANIFSYKPYVAFVDSKGDQIEGTGFEFNAPELIGKTDELEEFAKNFIKEKGWILIN